MVYTSSGVHHYFCTNDVVWCHQKWRHTFWRHLLSLPCQFSIFEDFLGWQPWIGLTFVVVLVLAKNTSQRQRGPPVYWWPLVLDCLRQISRLIATNALEKINCKEAILVSLQECRKLHTLTNRKRQRTQLKIRFAFCRTQLLNSCLNWKHENSFTPQFWKKK